jgi:hypothetical protein
MSYRGSFATEYIYDKDYFYIVKEVLSPYYWNTMTYKEHIISGAIRDLDEETMIIEFENLLDEISDKVKGKDIIRIILFGETFTTYYKISKDKVDVVYQEEKINE